MDLTICVVNWNVKDDLARCLDSLRAAAPGLAVQTIVVDNASRDGSQEMVRERYPEVMLVANEANVGFAAANVQAMQQARGRYLLMLNPDTLVPEGGLTQLVRFADANPGAGIVAPKLVYGDGSLQFSCRRFPTIGAALFRNTILGRLMPRARASECYLMQEWDHGEVREVDWVSGACLMVRREAYEEVGDLDVGFYWGSEDVDYCWRMHKAGWQVLYTPEPAVVHFVGRSTSQVQIATIVRTHKSMYRLYSKHLAGCAVGRGLVWLGVWARAGLMMAHYWTNRLVGVVMPLFTRGQREGAA